MKNKDKINNNSQLDKANSKLKDLVLNITTTDRKEAPCSESVLVQYLKGEGTNLEMAMKLFKYFKACIAKREKELSEEVLPATA